MIFSKVCVGESLVSYNQFMFYWLSAVLEWYFDERRTLRKSTCTVSVGNFRLNVRFPSIFKPVFRRFSLILTTFSDVNAILPTRFDVLEATRPVDRLRTADDDDDDDRRRLGLESSLFSVWLTARRVDGNELSSVTETFDDEDFDRLGRKVTTELICCDLNNYMFLL